MGALKELMDSITAAKAEEDVKLQEKETLELNKWIQEEATPQNLFDAHPLLRKATWRGLLLVP